MPTISVIVPVYKVEPYLRRCVDSILAQTYTDFELILVDDGSPDNCGAICDEYAAKDRRIRVLHQENGGLSAARNAGLDVAEGEYIALVDSDDIVFDNYLEKLLGSLLAEQADVSICGMVSFADGTEPVPDRTQQLTVAMTGREACLDIYCMKGKVPIMACGKLYKASLFESIRYLLGKIHEDDATTPRVLYGAEKVVLSSEQLYGYRQRGGSIVNERFSLKRFDIMDGIDLCIDFFATKEDDELVKLAGKMKKLALAKATVRACHAGIEKEVPARYQMSEWKALRIIRRYASDDLYTWFLSMNHPKLEKPHSYVRKIETMLKLR